MLTLLTKTNANWNTLVTMMLIRMLMMMTIMMEAVMVLGGVDNYDDDCMMTVRLATADDDYGFGLEVGLLRWRLNYIK